MIEVIQVVDMHLGIWYKLAVYKVVRREMMKRLEREKSGVIKDQDCAPDELEVSL